MGNCPLCALWKEALLHPAATFESEARQSKLSTEWSLGGIYHFFIITLLFGLGLLFAASLDARITSWLSARGFDLLSGILIGLPLLGVWVVFCSMAAMVAICVTGLLMGARADLPKFSFFFSLSLPPLLFLLPFLYHVLFLLAGRAAELEWLPALASGLVGAWGLFMLTHAVRVSMGLDFLRALLTWAIPLAIALAGVFMAVPLMIF